MSIQIRAVVLSLLLACAPGATSAQTITLKYGQAYSALRSIFALPLLVAEREGYFAREGLNFVTVPIPGGGETLIEALHNGTADMTHVATPFLIQAALKGSDAVAIAFIVVLSLLLGFRVVASLRKRIRRPQRAVIA